MSNPWLSEVQKFVQNEDENLSALEIKDSTPTSVKICIGDTFNFTISSSNPGTFLLSSSEDVLEDLIKKTNTYIKENSVKSVNEILTKTTELWNIEDDEDEDEMNLDDDDEFLEEAETPLDPSLLDESDPFEDISLIKKKRGPSEFEEIEELKKRFNLKNANKPAVSRLLKDYLQLNKGNIKQLGFHAAPKNNNLFDWEVKLFGFNEKDDLIAKDLKEYKKKFGMDYILLSMVFPPEYPFAPPFIRLLKPRMVFHTGHITIGGSICLQLLTKAGWMPSNSIEAIFVQIRLSITEGGCRIDFSNTSEYTMYEAKEAFYRVARRYGWEK